MNILKMAASLELGGGGGGKRTGRHKNMSPPTVKCQKEIIKRKAHGNDNVLLTFSVMFQVFSPGS